MISSNVTQNWLTITIICLIGLIALLHFLYKDRFNKILSFSKDKEYFIEFIDKAPFYVTMFSGLLFVISLGIFALFFKVVESYIFNVTILFTDFIKILIILFTFVLLRFLIGVILSLIFGIDKMQRILSIYKFVFLAKASIYIFPMIILLSYIQYINDLLFQLFFGFSIVLLLIFYSKILFKNQKIIFRNLFYFILYLCALEIMPLVYLFKILFNGYDL